jgi:S1-C subfamily serine protease
MCQITTTAADPDYNDPWSTFSSVKSTGTGFAIDHARRWIMTNAHVVENATLIQVGARLCSENHSRW